MSIDSDQRDPIEALAEKYVEELRLGHAVSIQEFADRHPQYRNDLLSILPTLVALEGLSLQTEKENLSHRSIQRVGDFKVIREIGRGGMGIVYEAEQESLNRKVALKVVHAQALTGNQLERFRQEARSAARLHHTNIVPVFQVGEEDGINYYAMQFIHGQTLADVLIEVERLRQGEESKQISTELEFQDTVTVTQVALNLLQRESKVSDKNNLIDPFQLTEDRKNEIDNTDPSSSTGNYLVEAISGSELREPRLAYHERVAELGFNVADALAYAHQEGILHRDIKPSNLLLDFKGAVWVTDFGLAKADEEEDLTATGNIVGTLRYMAPERFEGQEGATSDVYSLGVTLYELLTLKPAFTGTDRAQLMKVIATSEPTPLRKIEPTIPKDLETIILKSISKNPQQRYTSAKEMAEDLQRFLNYEPLQAKRITQFERMWRWCQRNRAVASLSTIVMVLVIALALGGTITSIQLTSRSQTAEQRLSKSLLQEGRAWRRTSERGRRKKGIEALVEARKRSPIREVREELLGVLTLMDLEEVDSWSPNGEGVLFDPFLKRAAVELGSSLGIFSGPRYETLEMEIPLSKFTLGHAVFSSSGKYFAICTLNRKEPMKIFDLELKKEILSLPAPPRGIPCAFSKNEKLIAISHRYDSISIRSIPDGAIIQEIELRGKYRRLVFSHDDTRLAMTNYEPLRSVLTLYDISENNLVGRIYHPGKVDNVSWHPHRDEVLSTCHDFNAYIWNANTLKKVHTLEGHQADGIRAFYSHDGTLISSSDWSNHAIYWDALSGRKILTARGGVKGFSKDDREVILVPNPRTFVRAEVQGNQELRTLHVPVTDKRIKHPRRVALSKNGRWLLAPCSGMGARIWNLQNPRIFAQIEVGLAEGVTFHPQTHSVVIQSQRQHLEMPLREEKEGHWVLGSPIRRPIPGDRPEYSPDGKYYASRHRGKIILYDAQNEAYTKVHAFRHPGVSKFEFSPSGKYLLSSVWHGKEVHIWEVESKEIVWSFPVRSGVIRISPDEKIVGVCSGPEARFFSTDTWEQVFYYKRIEGGGLPGNFAFTHDSKFLILTLNQQQMILLETENWKELATLEPPKGNTTGWCDFSPKADYFAMCSTESNSVSLWDMKKLRKSLNEFQLDWEVGENLEGLPSFNPAKSLRVEYGENNKYKLPPLAHRGHEEDRQLSFFTEYLREHPKGEVFALRAEINLKRKAYGAVKEDLLMVCKDFKGRFEKNPSDFNRVILLESLRELAKLTSLLKEDQIFQFACREIKLIEPQDRWAQYVKE